MKKALVFTLVILCLACSFILSCKESDIPAGMVQISDTSLVDYIMYAPSGWIVDSAPGKTTGAHVSDTDRTGISVQKLTYGNLGGWWSDYSASLSSQFKDSYQIVETDVDVLISGLNAKKHVFTVSFGTTLLKYELYGVVRGGSVYTITVVYYGAKTNTAEGETIVYSDTSYGDTMKTIIENFKFVDLGDSAEPVFEADNTPEGMKCASNTKIVDYFLFVPEHWTVENTAGTVSAASYYGTERGINVSVMQWNGYKSSFSDEAERLSVAKLWRNEYFSQIYSAIDSSKIPSKDGEFVVNEKDGLVHFEKSDLISIDKDLEAVKLGEDDAFLCTYTATIGTSAYNYYVVSTFHRSSVYVITFTIRAEDSYAFYNGDINDILAAFKFD